MWLLGIIRLIMEGLQHFRSQELLKIGLFWEVLREGFRDFDGSGGFWGSWSFGDFGGSWGHGVEGYVFFGIKKFIYLHKYFNLHVCPSSFVCRLSSHPDFRILSRK